MNTNERVQKAKPVPTDRAFVQTRILNALIDKNVRVTFLDGSSLEGKLSGFDIYSVVVANEMLFKHAIARIKQQAQFRKKKEDDRG